MLRPCRHHWGATLILLPLLTPPKASSTDNGAHLDTHIPAPGWLQLQPGLEQKQSPLSKWALVCWGLGSSGGDRQRVLVPGPQSPVELCLSQEGDTALHDATRLSRYKIIKTLILHGADMMAMNEVSVWGQHRGHLLPHHVAPPCAQPLSAHPYRLARPRQTWCSSGRWTHARHWRPRSSHRGSWKSLHDGTRQGPGAGLSSKEQDPDKACLCQ